MQIVKQLLSVSALALVLGASAPAIAHEDHDKDGKYAEKHIPKRGEAKEKHDDDKRDDSGKDERSDDDDDDEGKEKDD